MTYSEEDIQKYLNILHTFNLTYNNNIPNQSKTPEKVSCYNCGNTHFFKDGGFRYCKKMFSISWSCFC